MRLDRLFHVLVVMSAPAVSACEAGDDERDERRDDRTDAGTDPVNAAQDAGAGSGSGSALEPCFCDTQTCCDRSTSEPQVADGFECCWSTTCP